MIITRDLNIQPTNKICGIHGTWLTYWILANISWQVQGHFCRTMRCQDSLIR
jgi:hypothetical protein